MNTFQANLVRVLLDLALDLGDEWMSFSDQRTNELIVKLLNENGIKTERGKEWTLKRWRDCRRSMAVNETTGRKVASAREIGEILERAGLDEELGFCRAKDDELGYSAVNYVRLRSEVQKKTRRRTDITSKRDKDINELQGRATFFLRAND
jgi:hypothetical protein